MGYGARNRRLAGARHPLQPEYALAIGVFRPSVNLAEEGDPRLRMAFGIELVVNMVKCGAFGGA
jgi:hypothetical protein